MSNSLRPHGLQSTRTLCPWDSPGKNTEVGGHPLLQQIFPTQGSNPSLYVYWHWQPVSLPLAPPLYLMTHKNRLRWWEWGMSINMCHLLKLPRMLPFPRWRRWHREVELWTQGHTLEGIGIRICIHSGLRVCVGVCVGVAGNENLT